MCNKYRPQLNRSGKNHLTKRLCSYHRVKALPSVLRFNRLGSTSTRFLALGACVFAEPAVMFTPRMEWKRVKLTQWQSEQQIYKSINKPWPLRTLTTAFRLASTIEFRQSNFNKQGAQNAQHSRLIYEKAASKPRTSVSRDTKAKKTLTMTYEMKRKQRTHTLSPRLILMKTVSSLRSSVSQNV